MRFVLASLTALATIVSAGWQDRLEKTEVVGKPTNSWEFDDLDWVKGEFSID